MRPDPAIRLDAEASVYPPGEDSRLLLEAADVVAGERVLDVGTGTGFLALHAAGTARVAATDLNPAAAALARRNARANGLDVGAVRCDLMAALRGPFDVILFNPPYLEGPAMDAQDLAWQGGDEGGGAALRFLDDLPRVLAPSGRAYLLLSETNGKALACARERFRVRVAASTALFFERLVVLELRLPGPPARRAPSPGRERGP